MYSPDKKILKNYAKVLIDFALGKGQRIKSVFYSVGLFRFELKLLFDW